MSQAAQFSSPGRILVVDDQAANLRVVSTVLARKQYEVQVATNGEEALALAEAAPPDLILLDMMMPGMDGFGLLDEIKQRPQLLRVPVVFLTSAQDRDLLLRAFDAGAVDYVTKPFMPEELLARVHAHLSLKLARDRLERIAQERQELVNLVAHDLKNPLTSVLFASDLILSDGCKPERVPRYLKMIHESADDALGYIRRYLETQAGQREAAAATQGRVALGAVIERLVSRYGMQFESTGGSLSVVAPDADAAQVRSDPLVLRQVAENLITNAIKYAPGSEVTLAARRGAPGYWQLAVMDRGPGIPSSRQRELFKPFSRLQEHDPAGGLSSGLGLSLARQIVADAGGSLWYEDRDGGGAAFIIELPEAADGDVAAAPAVEAGATLA